MLVMILLMPKSKLINTIPSMVSIHSVVVMDKVLIFVFILIDNLKYDCVQNTMYEFLFSSSIFVSYFSKEKKSVTLDQLYW